MARSYASVYLTIWSDPDFRELSWDAQWLYFVMLTHPTLTTCGVMDWRESRLANMADGVTVRSLREAAWQLGQRRLIAVDPDTEEALVRSFVRHDGTLKSPNLAKALVREYGGIASLKLMELVSIEVRRAVGENPDWKGCDLVEPITKQFTEPIRNPSELVPDWFHDGSESVPNRFENRSLKTTQKTGNPSDLVSPPHPHPHPVSKDTEGADSAESSKPARPASRKRPFPADWKPTEAHSKRARELGIDLSWEATKFQDSALANGRTYLDWDRAFSNWLSRAKEFSGGVNRSRPVNDDPYFYLNKPRGGSDA